MRRSFGAIMKHDVLLYGNAMSEKASLALGPSTVSQGFQGNIIRYCPGMLAHILYFHHSKKILTSDVCAFMNITDAVCASHESPRRIKT